MALTQSDIVINKNDHFRRRYSVQNNGSVVDISGYTFTGQLYTVSDAAKVYDFTVDISELASNKKIIMKLKDEQTDALDINTEYQYYYQWIDDNSERKTWLQGKFNVIAGGKTS